MMSITITVGGRVTAIATATNISELADVSSYEVIGLERAAPSLGIPASRIEATIEGHPRRQSVWALVEKVAALAKEAPPAPASRSTEDRS